MRNNEQSSPPPEFEAYFSDAPPIKEMEYIPDNDTGNSHDDEPHMFHSDDNGEDATPPPDYEILLEQVQSFTKDTPPDVLGLLLQQAGALDKLSLQKIMKLVKDKTEMTLQAQRDYMRDERLSYSESDKTDHLTLARQVVADIGQENLLSTTAHTWRYSEDKGVWRPAEDRAVKQWVQRSLEGCNHPVDSGDVSGTMDVLKTEIYAEGHYWNHNQEIINFTNGSLHWQDEGWLLQLHSRVDYCTTHIPHAYNPQAKAPRFILFLREVFADDADGADKARLVLEIIGYCMVAHAKFETFVLLIGAGANGKSVLLDVIRTLVGGENVSAVQPSQFTNKFQRAHLHMKLVNLVTEIAEGGEIADAELKAITSGELTTAEHKNKPPFDFMPYATCLFGTNHLPHTRDFSDALFRRAKVIRFNRVFSEAEQDPNLKGKLAAEIEGIIALSLEAFARVVRNQGTFTEPESCTIAKQEWRKEADQVAQFIEDKCRLDTDASYPSSEMYAAYETWTRNVGIVRKLNRKNFTTRMERHGAVAKKGTGGTRMIAGFYLMGDY